MASPMLRQIVVTSIQLRFLVIAVVAILIGWALIAFQEVPVDVYPEFDPPGVEVQTEALGLSATEVEALITVPLEADLLNGVAWLEDLYSQSVEGLSSIILVFEEGIDPIRARQMVQERLTQSFALPKVSKPPTMLQPKSSTNRVMMVGLSPKDNVSLIELGVIARWNVRPRLLGIPGVANVSIWGQRERQLQVQVDPRQLQTKGLTLQQVIGTVGNALWVSPLSFLNASAPGTAGWIDTPNQRLSLHHLFPITGPAELAQVSVEGVPNMTLGDVAKVVEDHQPLIGDAKIRNNPGLILVIEKFPGASTLEVTEETTEALDVMRPGLSGIEIDTTLFRPATYIMRAMKNLALAFGLGVIFVVLVFVISLDSLRSVVISTVSILVSFVIAGLVLYARGLTLNAMVVAGGMIAVGAIVGDTVVYGGHNRRDREVQKIPDIVLAHLRPIVAATLILLVMVLPLFLLPSPTKMFLRPLILSFIVTVLVSFVVALVVAPALTALIAPRAKRTGKQSPLLQWLQSRYCSSLTYVLHAPRGVCITIIAVVVIGILILPAFDLSLVPEFKQTDLLIQWEGLPGTSREEMNRIAAQAANELRSTPGVVNVGFHVGRAIGGDQVVGINSGELWVHIDPRAQYELTVAAVQEVIDGYPGLQRTVGAYQPKRANQLFTRQDRNLVVRIYGNEWEELRRQAERVQESLSQIDGLKDPSVVVQDVEPQVEVEVDLASALRHQIKPGDVRRQVTTLVSGLQVGNLFEEQKVFDVVVWGVPEVRRSITDILNLAIDTPRGPVRLADLAAVRVASTPTVITRHSVSRFLDVNAAIRNRNLNDVIRSAQDTLVGMEFPLEYHAEVLKETYDYRAALQRVGIAAFAALIGIVLLLQAAFESWRLAFFSFITLPFALVGGIVAALAAGSALTLGSLLGLVAVIVIAVRQMVIAIHHVQHLEREENETSREALIIRGMQEHLAPLLVTLCATGLGTIPILIFGSKAGLEILYPAAVVLVGGLITTVVFVLFGLPAVYLTFGHVLHRRSA